MQTRFERLISSEWEERPFSRAASETRKMLCFFKKQFRKQSDSEGVFSGSFYLVERVCKEIIRAGNTGAVHFCEKMPVCGEIFLIAEESGISEESLAREILRVSAEKYISNTDLEQLSLSLGYAVLCRIFEALKSGNDKELSKWTAMLYELGTIDTERVNCLTNPLEKIFSEDEKYVLMTAETRAAYRRKTSAVAYAAHLDEQKLANEYVRLCKKPRSVKGDHVGWYIYKDYRRLFRVMKPKTYFLWLLIPTLLISAGISAACMSLWLWLAALPPAYAVVKCFVDAVVKFRAEPFVNDELPKMELSEIPNDAKTLAVISALLASDSNPDSVKSGLDKLEKSVAELCYTNQERNLFICLLFDLKQSTMQSEPSDRAVCGEAKKLAERLNARFGEKVCVIVRKRTYSKTQREYTGFERKRGAIEQLVRQINGEKQDFLATAGNIKILPEIRYICALDSDTTPLMDTIKTLVSAAVHPIMTPVFEENRVVEGYGIIAPRIATRLKSSLRTPFSRILGGVGGTCTYDAQSSDFYMSAFAESIFTGKGLIDADAFYKGCVGRFPEERVLSHDIIEGSILRTAYDGGIEFTDSFPQNSMSFFKRLERWYRGDVQNITFLVNSREKGINTLSRLKIWDNVRRAITPAFVMKALIVGAFAYRGEILTGTALAAILLPYIFGLFSIIRSCTALTFSAKYYSGVKPQAVQLLQLLLTELILLPKYAAVSAKAYILALWRLFVSHRNLLQWTTASQAEAKALARSIPLSTAQSFIWAEALALVLIASLNPFSLVLGIYFLAALPVMLYCNSRKEEKKPQIHDEQRLALINEAERIWHFYRDFVTEKENFLPPDNVQHSPVFRIAHRTSPTNIGMYLVSLLAARDFGFLNNAELFDCVGKTLSTVDKLEKLNGNLFNWYDTQSLKRLDGFVSCVDGGNFLCCLTALREGLREYGANALCERIDKLINEADLGMLYNSRKKLFSIGFNAENGETSSSCYDLLMSEARMTSYFAIAKGYVPKRHWSALSRTMSKLHGYAGALSWTGTMFEYFMPELFLKCERGSLGYESLRFAIYCQKHRAAEAHTPYGMSESGFFAFDSRLNYQYKAHGVQLLGLKRGLDDEKVVAPYASFLSLPFAPSFSTDNLVKLERLGARHNKYGFYEAVDYTEQRLDGAPFSIVKSHMSHHIGMSMISIANHLNDGIFQRRFMRDSEMNRAHELLEEKIIIGEIMFEDYYKKHQQEKKHFSDKDTKEMSELSVFSPRAAMLTNGAFTGVYTDVGAYYGIFNGSITLAKTEDFLRRPRGGFFALSERGKLLPLTKMPFSEGTEQSAVFSSNCIEYYANGGGLMCAMKVVLHPEYACEIRKIVVANKTSAERKMSLCALLEPVLAPQEDYSAHPMFMDLFLKIRYDEGTNSIIAVRKKRHSDEQTFMFIAFSENVSFNYSLSREAVTSYTDSPRDTMERLSELRENVDGCVPHPCIAIRADLSAEPHKKCGLTLLTLTGKSENELFAQLDDIRKNSFEEVSAGESTPERLLSEEMLTNVVFGGYSDNEIVEAVGKNTLPSTELWRYGISGDFPIVTVEIESCTDGMCAEKIRNHLKAQNILRTAQIRSDLVFVISQSALSTAARETATELSLGDHLGKSIFIVDTHEADERLITLIRAMSCAFFGENHEAQNSFIKGEMIPLRYAKAPDSRGDYGHFEDDGYVVTEKPPRPWCNVLANGAFGTLVSSCSLGFTWALNSRENKLTPWFNDVFTDNRGELLLLKIGEEYYDIINGSTARFTPVTAVWRGKCGEIECETTVFAAEKGGAKIIDVRLTNNGTDVQAALAYYCEPVLGSTLRGSDRVTAKIEENALVMRSFTNRSYGGAAAITADGAVYVNDRVKLLRGDWERAELYPNPNPCGAAVITRKLPPKHTEKIRYILSYSETPETVTKCASVAKNAAPSHFECDVKITTPDEKLNALFNTWLPHQTLTGRMRARTGFYQNGGAFGFRDQLQDAIAAAIFAPKLAKRQILRACTAQFADGDVMHWWHVLPNVRKGVRTRYSDDLLWLPFVLCDYLEKTADYEILATKTAFAEGERLSENEHERYIETRKTAEKATVYEHARLAVDYAFRTGAHGLMLMGCGDWNDGYNNVGISGKGESVWLTMFMVMVLERFSTVAERQGENGYAQTCLARAKQLRKTIDENAWDETHYLRAFFDNGEKLGADENAECRIDALPQAFAVLAKLHDEDRKRLALESAVSRLVDFDNGIIRLFDPPFGENAKQNAGYVNSYPEGVRENGGQYTHAAVWLTMAVLRSGDTENGIKMLSMLNPSERHKTRADTERFRNEPYFMTADIYTNPTAYGRGGWSIYTGAAAWYYKCIFEELLGVEITTDGVKIEPKIPREWNDFSIEMTVRDTQIKLIASHSAEKVMTDNGRISDRIELDGKYHLVKLGIS